MGMFSGLEQEKYDRQYSDRDLVRRLAGYFAPHKRRLLIVIACVLGIALAGAITPVAVARAVDTINSGVLASGGLPTIAFPLVSYFGVELTAILLISGVVFTAGVFIWWANWLRRRLVTRMMGDIILTIRTEAFRAAAEHDLSFYDEFASGKVVSRITSDTQEFGQMVLLLTDILSPLIQTIILSVVLLSIDWKLSLLLFAFVPALFFSASAFRKLARRVTSAGMRAMAHVNATIKETISGIAVAKNFRREAGIFSEFEQANNQSYAVNVRRGLVLSLIFPALNALGGLATGALVYFGGLTVAAGVVTLGAWFLFLQSLDRFFFPVLNLSAFWSQVQQGLAAAERAFALIDAESQVIQSAANQPPDLKGDIRFEGVWFAYSASEPVLCDFSLNIRPGETVALVGHTGAGKSSIAKLVARFYEFQRGRLSVDGQDIRSFDLHAYRSHLGIVSQTPFLFSGSISENICYACPSGGQLAEIERLSRRIGDGEWLESLPDGLNTQVGERGGRLSMGQRQLVALLRVLVHHPAIFILDEATASVDPFTEWQIQQALNLILSNATSILIAHRLSTVKAADRIIVLDDGKIIEEGSHTDLLAHGGHYAGLYNTYFRHQSLAYVENAKDLATGSAVTGNEI